MGHEIPEAIRCCLDPFADLRPVLRRSSRIAQLERRCFQRFCGTHSWTQACSCGRHLPRGKPSTNCSSDSHLPRPSCRFLYNADSPFRAGSSAVALHSAEITAPSNQRSLPLGGRSPRVRKLCLALPCLALPASPPPPDSSTTKFR